MKRRKSMLSPPIPIDGSLKVQRAAGKDRMKMDSRLECNSGHVPGWFQPAAVSFGRTIRSFPKSASTACLAFK